MAPDRRQSFQVAVIGALAMLVLAAPAVIAAVYLWPPPSPPPPEVVIQLGTFPASGRAVLFEAPAGRAFAIDGPTSQMDPGLPVVQGWFARASSGGLYALSAYSTDTGCRLASADATPDLWDPCHGSVYGLDGAVLRGPALRPLPRLRWRSLGDARIAVITNK